MVVPVLNIHLFIHPLRTAALLPSDHRQYQKTVVMSSAESPRQESSMPPPASKIVLYSFWQSSCSWRVRFALNLKGLPYEYKSVNLAKGEQFSPEFEKLNPLHLIPVLVDGDVVVSDSLAILMYLEEKYPQNALLPADQRLKALNIQKLIEEKIGPAERLSWAQYNIEKGFDALEKLLKDSAAKYATGEELYMADVFLAPQIAVATGRFDIDMSKFPTLSKIFESCKALPEFQASLPERQPDAIKVRGSLFLFGPGVRACHEEYNTYRRLAPLKRVVNWAN
ncbi:glutathione S-transferase zeta class-like isoform X2 [Diospyros lotus]|uniref:glutathione S-transferase zeta class-like isoform X2 n=1 Tax=Diospyros lotus TaxID=55363 RepID=UPI00224CE7D6|nr:glutathione S-transferase zeta class-like isoform X2 [Diospyros lotus]